MVEMSANLTNDNDILDLNIKLVSENLKQILHEEQECVIPTAFKTMFQSSEIFNQVQFGILPQNPYYDTGDIQHKNVPLIAKSTVMGKVRNDKTKWNQKKPKPKKNYDKIVVDMSLLGLTTNCFEWSPIVRVMDLFRQMYYYLQDSLECEADCAHKTSRMPNVCMPQSMDLQTQLKNAEVQCIAFLSEMRSLVFRDDIVFNDNLFNVCLCSIKKMHNMIVELNGLKQSRLDHKNGQWASSSQVLGEYLETFLLELNDQIRETNIHVHVFAWDQCRTKSKLLEEQQCSIPTVNAVADESPLLNQQEQTNISELDTVKPNEMTDISDHSPMILDDKKNVLSEHQYQWSDIVGNRGGNTKHGFLRYIGSK